MKRRRSGFEIFSLSFLDVVSCGFGAIVLLLVMIKISEPGLSQEGKRLMENEIVQLQAITVDSDRQSAEVAAKLQQRRRDRHSLEEQLTELENRLGQAEQVQTEIEQKAAAQEIVFRQLYQAKQDLTEEMRRLRTASREPLWDEPIGGIPVDSEYIIFVIDTSGSMQQFAWPAVRRKMKEILEIYPQVRGIQVMNDMGEYMFSQYAGRWIPDTPARRKAVLERLRSWMPFSNSSPVEGISAAIKRFYASDRKISIYVLGDDFSRGSIQAVVDTVSFINRSLEDGSRRVRIHAIGFPVLFGQPGAELNVSRFAALMRRLAEDNDGSFVGLTNLR